MSKISTPIWTRDTGLFSALYIELPYKSLFEEKKKLYNGWKAIIWNDNVGEEIEIQCPDCKL